MTETLGNVSEAVQRYGAYQLLRMETPVSNPWPGGDEGYAANSKIAVKPDNTRDGSDHTGMQYGASVMGCVKLSDFSNYREFQSIRLSSGKSFSETVWAVSMTAGSR